MNDRRHRNERGGVFIIGAFLLALGALLVIATGSVITATVLRARVSAAADAAALAAADQIVLGLGVDAACRVASDVARANGASIEVCDATAGSASVVVRVAGTGWVPDARGRARAEIDWSRA